MDEARKQLDALADERSRDPESLSISVFGQPPDTARGRIDDFLNAGVEQVAVWARYCESEDEMSTELERMAGALVR